MTSWVEAATVKSWLSDGGEIAFFDVREHGQYGEGHPFFAVPLPYSVFELRLPELAPNRAVRTVLLDNGDGVSEKAAARANELGYLNVSIVTGGATAWREAGYELFEGVNLPSKTFGEILELERHTPRKTADEVEAMRQSKADCVIVDGRPFSEYTKFNIPDGVCCPNGELVLRIGEIVPSPETTVIVNCAGRTRSILGAQTLIDFGIPNPVYALENGTQGWFLAGLENERGADRIYPAPPDVLVRTVLRDKARRRAETTGVAFVSGDMVDVWLAESDRTTYLFDVRTHEEFQENTAPGLIHAPGGQLVQATDQWVGVKGARLVIVDDDLVRAPMVANWLHQLGHEVGVLEGGVAAAKTLTNASSSHVDTTTLLPEISANDVGDALRDDATQLIDIRPSMKYRAGHIEEALWSIRPRVEAAIHVGTSRVVLVTDQPDRAALVAKELATLGVKEVLTLDGAPEDWRRAGLTVTETADQPRDSDCIDFLFFTHERHAGSVAASQQYLDWEVGLVDRLDPQERAIFRVASP